MRRPCYVVDSFAAHPLSGNPAGVLLDGAELDGKAMQRIANELKHSETAFPLPAREPTAALHLRWFTPEAEVAFCGHATLAAFHVLVEEARRIRVPDGAVTRIAPRKSVILEGNLYLALRDRDALARCRPDGASLEQLAKPLGVAGYVVYTLDPQPGVDAAVRCFFPGYGILEDPVTGSAAGQLGALIQTVLPGAFPRRLVFTQGDEMGRPGRVEVEVRPDPGPGKVRGWIGGNAVTVLRGELEL